jgi:hypothetical protein
MINPTIILIAPVIGLTTGVAAGILPAHRASKTHQPTHCEPDRPRWALTLFFSLHMMQTRANEKSQPMNNVQVSDVSWRRRKRASKLGVVVGLCSLLIVARNVHIQRPLDQQRILRTGDRHELEIKAPFADFVAGSFGFAVVQWKRRPCRSHEWERAVRRSQRCDRPIP